MDFASLLVDRGYAKAWFNWLEWIVLTSAIYAIALKANSGFLVVLAVMCTIILFFIGLVGVEKVIKDTIPSIQHRTILSLLIVGIVSSIGLSIVSNVLFSLLPANIKK